MGGTAEPTAPPAGPTLPGPPSENFNLLSPPRVALAILPSHGNFPHPLQLCYP